MSGHLIGCVKPIRTLPKSHKLALVAFADSADDRTHIGFPGYEGVQEWADVSRGRAAELIRDLVEWGYLKPHKRGHRGQRAEYVVFPDGCCDLHRTPVEEPPVDVEQLAAAAGVSVDQARLMLAAMTSGGADVPTPAPEPVETEKGSEAPDASSGNGSDAPDPNDPDVQPEASEAVDNPGKGPESVQGSRSIADAFTPSQLLPPLPPGQPGGDSAEEISNAPAAGPSLDELLDATGLTVDAAQRPRALELLAGLLPATCARHGRNRRRACRGCGTTPRLLERAGIRVRNDLHRLAEQDRIRAERATQAASGKHRAASADLARKLMSQAGVTA